jgi:hypothetical protein
MAALLDWSQKGVFFDPDQSGKLVETFAHHELAVETALLPRELADKCGNGFGETQLRNCHLF